MSVSPMFHTSRRHDFRVAAHTPEFGEPARSFEYGWGTASFTDAAIEAYGLEQRLAVNGPRAALPRRGFRRLSAPKTNVLVIAPNELEDILDPSERILYDGGGSIVYGEKKANMAVGLTVDSEQLADSFLLERSIKSGKDKDETLNLVMRTPSGEAMPLKESLPQYASWRATSRLSNVIFAGASEAYRSNRDYLRAKGFKRLGRLAISSGLMLAASPIAHSYNKHGYIQDQAVEKTAVLAIGLLAAGYYLRKAGKKILQKSKQYSQEEGDIFGNIVSRDIFKTFDFPLFKPGK